MPANDRDSIRNRILEAIERENPNILTRPTRIAPPPMAYVLADALAAELEMLCAEGRL